MRHLIHEGTKYEISDKAFNTLQRHGVIIRHTNVLDCWVINPKTPPDFREVFGALLRISDED